MTDAARLRYLAAHQYREQIVAFLLRAAFGEPGVAWRWCLLDTAHEIQKESEQ